MKEFKAIAIAAMLTVAAPAAVAVADCDDIYRNPVIPNSAPDPLLSARKTDIFIFMPRKMFATCLFTGRKIW